MEERSYSSKIWLTPGVGLALFIFISTIFNNKANFDLNSLLFIFGVPFATSFFILTLTFPVWVFLKVINYLTLKLIKTVTYIKIINQVSGIILYSLFYLLIRYIFLSSNKPFLWDEKSYYLLIIYYLSFSFGVWYHRIEIKDKNLINSL
ncbi:hypothetical protein [Adhaeribacter soli]|uniref:hypothetical protein n=1 Tax=Adhaeribacter soli TaxID=2607655 RepID=UPI00177C3E63|nr:hypothetical protein [Adhaeribacter soli]